MKGLESFLRVSLGTPLCFRCLRVSLSPLCTSCLKDLRRYNLTRLNDSRFKVNLKEIFWDELFSLIPYNQLSSTIRAVKAEKFTEAINSLSDLLYFAIQRDKLINAKEVHVTYIPQHPSERRLNLSLELSRAVHRALKPLNRVILSSLLLKNKLTEKQAVLPLPKRLKNVRGAFRGVAIYPPPSHILIVDDVVTTGATLNSASRALKEIYPSARIICLALAY